MENVKRIFEIDEIKEEDEAAAKKTVFYSTDSTSTVVWVVKP